MADPETPPEGGLADRATLAGLTGLEFMTRVASGALPPPPMARSLNFRLVSVEAGQTVFEGAPLFAHFNPMGGVHGGWYGALLDSCMGCAVMTTLPAGRIYTTLEYKVNLVRAIPEGRTVTARGTVSHAGRTTAVATGEIRDADTGRLFATGSTTCLIMDAA